jgi:hypothetical protein
MTPDKLYSLITNDYGGPDSTRRLIENIEILEKIKSEILFSDLHPPSLKILATAYIQAFHYEEKFKSNYNLYLWNEALCMNTISIEDVAEAYRLIFTQKLTHDARWSCIRRKYESQWFINIQESSHRVKAKNLADASEALLAYLKTYSNFQKDNQNITLDRKIIGIYEEQNPGKVFCRKLESVLKLPPGKCFLDKTSIRLGLVSYRGYESALIKLGLDVKYYFVHAFSFWDEGISIQNNLPDAIEILSKRQAEMLTAKVTICYESMSSK